MRVRLFGFILLFGGAAFASPRPRLEGAVNPELTTKWILEQLERPDVRSVEQLLGRFQSKSLERHLLVYGTESRQYASFLSPRVIVYSYDADFIFAFTGAPGKAGYNEIEILRFDHDARAFRPELITFDPEGRRKAKHDPRPTDCARCHQEDPRPNWEPYFHWPGVYGSEDDNVNAGPPSGKVTTGPEYEAWQLFKEKKARQVVLKTGRYRFLPEHPYYRPNDDFNDRVGCVNMKRMLRTFAAQPLAARVHPFVRSSRVNLGEMEMRDPELFARARRSYADVRAETQAVMRNAMRRRFDRAVELTGDQPHGRVQDLAGPTAGYFAAYDIEMVSQWRFVFEEILRIPFRPMSTSRHTDYNLNLGAVLHMMHLWDGSSVVDGRAVFERTGGSRSPYGGYGYTCPKTDSYWDLPVVEDLELPEYYEENGWQQWVPEWHRQKNPGVR